MLVIRDAQMAAFQACITRRLEEDIAIYLRERHADAVAELDAEALRRRVAEGVERCCAYGITKNADICWFVVMTFRVSPRFDEAPSFARILSDPTRPAATRVERLLAWATAEDWAEAAAR